MTTHGRIVAAINPTAGKRRHRGVPLRLLTALREAGWTVVPLIAESFSDLHADVRATLAPTDILLVIGGDGMVSLGINIVHDTGNPLAVFPLGTGNDFARGLGFEVDEVEANIPVAVSLLTRKPIRLDVAQVTGAGVSRLVGGVVSAGFDALVNERANRMSFPRGASRYTWAIFFELVKLTARTYRIRVDGHERVEQAVLISVANNAYMGGGMWVTPAGSLTDGHLELFIVRPVSRRRLVRLLPTVFTGQHIDEPEVVIASAREVTLESEGIVAYGDGERLGALPLTVTVLPSAVRVFVPVD